MTLNSLAIRVAAVATIVASGALYAAEYGLIGDNKTAQAMQNTASSGLDLTFGAFAPRPGYAPGNMASDLAQRAMLDGPLTNIVMTAAEVDITPGSFDLPAGPTRPALAGPSRDRRGEMSRYGMPCTVALDAVELPMAIAQLELTAPCRPNAHVTVLHSGLRLAAETDALGTLRLALPGLTSPAHFSVIFDDGLEQIAQVELAELAEFERVALLWRGNQGLSLAAHSAQDGLYGDQMSMFRTGDTNVQVYTLPRALLSDEDHIALTITAPVTPTNCDTVAQARALQTQIAQPVSIMDLTFNFPGCDQTGDVLVLQNVLTDLRLTAN